MKQGSNNLRFFYDAQSRPAMVDFNGTKYTYLHNLQGDIVGMLDSAGNLVVEYKYDSWGKPVSVRTLTIAYDTLANLNPFRYRGYVWDEETGWYYLRSRYYNPEWGRFINADVLLGKTGGLLSHNGFAYCANNSILRSDDGGNLWRGAVHRSLQELLVKIIISSDMEKEVLEYSGEKKIVIGRMDFFVLGSEIGMYEIKRSRDLFNPSSYAQTGNQQLDNYAKGHLKDDDRKFVRGEMELHGTFIYYDKKSNARYLVQFNTVKSLILYDYERIDDDGNYEQEVCDGDVVLWHVPALGSDYNRQVLYGNIAMATMVFAAGGGAMMFMSPAQYVN